MSKKGIDVSTWQSNIDFEKAKADGYDFVIIRAGYGRVVTQKDNRFEQHYKAAKAAGMAVGAYHYSYAKSAAEAKIEASVCLEWLKGKTFELPIYFDMEESSVASLGKNTCTAIAKAFCEKVKAAGYKVGIYSNPNWFMNYLDYNSLKKSYSIWLAQWGVNSPQMSCDIWQYTSDGKVDGYSGRLDCNISYIDFDVKNNDKKPTPPKPDTSSKFKKGDKVKVTKAVTYDGQAFTTYFDTYEVMEAKGDRIVIGKDGTVTAAVNSSNLTKATANKPTTSKPTTKTIKEGGKVKVLKAVTYDGQPFTTYFKEYDVIEVKGDRVVIGIGKEVTAAVKKSNLKAV